MKSKNICILGGTGFVGKNLATLLSGQSYRLTVLTRHRERHRDLLLIPNVELVEADIFDLATLITYFEDAQVVINLVGILNETGAKGQGFRQVHVDLARTVVTACNQSNVNQLLHMSAINADAIKGPSQYLFSKGEGEDLVHAAAFEDFQVTSFKPSVIFGPEDDFFNRFASLLRLTPGVFPLACPYSRFAPVYVGDVARAFAAAIDNPNCFGNRYELCGPQIFSLKKLVEYTAHTCGLRRRVIGLNNTLSKWQARMLELVPGKPFSMDNYLSLQTNSVCRENGMKLLGIEPATIDAIVPDYIGRRHPRQQYNAYRQQARRPVE